MNTRVVPLEPTPEMLEPFARQFCIVQGIDPDKQVSPDWPAWYPTCQAMAACYEAMLAAAPPAADAVDARDKAVGAAIERAARDLPEDYELHVELERGAGTVRLYMADGESCPHFGEADTLAGNINAAIDAALSAGTKDG